MAGAESKGSRRYDKENLLWQSTVAIRSDPVGNASGHVGIVDFDGSGISAGMLNVNRNFHACNQDTVLRKYTGGEE